MIPEESGTLLSRREFIKAAALAGGTALLAACQSKIPPGNRKKNIILIITDDQRWDTLGRMPNLQNELIARGVSFRNVFATTPLCSPSRASILTGLYAHHHGVRTNGPPDGDPFDFDASATIAIWLQQAGYRTALIGKYLHDPSEDPNDIPVGWDVWHTFVAKNIKYRYYYDYKLNENGKIVYHGTDQANYSTDVLTSKAVDFIKEAGDEPFFIHLSYAAPHEPRTPASRHEGMYADLPPWRPPSFNESLIDDKPQWVQSLDAVDADRVDLAQQLSYECLASVDDGIGDILQALRKTGKLDDTVIVYTSDQGLTWGEHRLLSAKNHAYEESIRLPLVVRYPGLTDEGYELKNLALNIDIAPTLADIAGVKIDGPVDGVSLLPLLTDRRASWRERIFIEHWPTGRGIGDQVPEYVATRNYYWKYIRYETGERELYHLRDDPYENFNLVDDPARSELVANLEQVLQKFETQRQAT